MIALALLLTGCGGAAAVDPAATATPATAADPNAATVSTPGADPAAATGIAATPSSSDDAPGVNSITNADAAKDGMVKISAITPKVFSAAHCAKPIMVVMYQPGAIVDEELLREARAAAHASAKDTVSIFYTPKDVKTFGDLPTKLGLLSTPGVAIVSRAGKIENFWTTYVDRYLIIRSLQYAASAKPCKVTSSDVPAAGSALKDAAVVANGGTVASTSATTLAGSASGTPAVDAAAATAGGGVDPNTGAAISG